MILAFWMVLVAALLPYVWVGVAKSGGRYNNSAPREFLEQTEGHRKRALWAQHNAFEAFPAFAAGVIIAHLAGGDAAWIDRLAVLFVLARIAHGLLYLTDKATLRSLVWMVGIACVIGLFILPVL